MKKILYLIITVASFSFFSCEDFLDKPPLDQIGNDSYWKTSTDLENYVKQFYTTFPTFGNPTNAGIFVADAYYGSDDAILSSVNTTLNGSSGIVNSGGNWTWGNIRSVNIFFDNYNKCQDDFSLWKSYLGEAHFFRAWFYFEKVKSYGDVPWYNTELKMDSENLYKARDSRTLVVDSILSDLDKAFEYLNPIVKASGGNNRLSKEAALIFKSRVALYEGTWQKYHSGTAFATSNANPVKYFEAAVNASEELMSGKYSVEVYGNNIEDYATMFGLDDMSTNKEIILWKGYDKSLNLAHDSQVYLTSRTNARSVTFELIESFLSSTGDPIDYYAVAKQNKGTDFLNYLRTNVDPRLSKTIWIPGDVMWNSVNGYKVFDKPYIGQSGEFINTTGFQPRKGVNITSPGAGGFFGGDSETGAIVFRYAEALLNYAEAKYELDQDVDYNKSINLLRKRAGMPDFKVINDPNRKRYADYGYVISDELYEIRRERRVEMASEGFRNEDYRRWRAHNLFKGKRPKGYPVDNTEWEAGVKIPPVDESGLLDPFKTSLPNGYMFDESRDYLEPIPTNEITLNPNLIQNPGW